MGKSDKIKALFLDRDGVINIDKGYVSRPEDFAFIPTFFDGARRFIENGYYIIIITNQSGIGRKYFPKEAYENLTRFYVNELKKKGISITGVYHCPHTEEDNCSCRKPNAGLLNIAIKTHNVDYEKSIMVGDKISDMIAGRKAKIPRCFLVETGQEIGVSADFQKVEDLRSLAELLFGK